MSEPRPDDTVQGPRSFTGSAVANVFGTGTFTIPLMKSVGYRPYFAGAVEAAASTGGQIMPPVMGSVFLASDDAAYITGVTLDINGGTLMI